MADKTGYIGRNPADSSVVVARQVFTPTGVTTDFTFTSGYTPGYLDLYLNGARLIEGSDYTATDTSTITLISAATGGDVLEGVAYKAFNVNGGNRIGIQSAGSLIGNIDTLNFVGTGNTFLINGTTVDVSISGGSAGVWGSYDGGTGITTTKKVRIQNNLSVGGTLTYEDVTNVDAVGLITAQSGIHVTGGNVGIGTISPEDLLHLETGNSGAGALTQAQLVLESSGSANWIHFKNKNTQNAGIAWSDPDNTEISTIYYNHSTDDLEIKADDDIKFITNSTERLRVTSGGLIDVSGGIQVSENVTPTTGSGVEIFKPSSTVGQVSVFDRDGAAWMDLRLKSNQLEVFAAGSERFRIAPSGQIGLGGANYGNAGQVITSNGSGSAPTWQDGGAGLTTEAFVKTTGQTATLNIGSAVDHKVTCTGTVTIDAVGGTAASNEGESHTIRIINNGTATVGFSTYFLWPSGASPSLPTATGAVSLISFTVNRVGAGGTQLLAGVSVNYS